MEENYDSDELFNKKLSKINSAILINFTLNNLWTDSFRHMKAGKFIDWNNDLDAIWIIIGGEPYIQNSDIEIEYIKINEELIKYGELTNEIKINGFGKIPDSEKIKRAKQKAILMKKALFLRRLQNEQGKGTAYIDETEDYLES